ncbi:nascent polypeptide-associated complex protein [Candidatus Woesearchaeota archaeon]|nr:nascent polypeptide-associated complex protein [Candidatus Woesearchaeota archaeon]
MFPGMNPKMMKQAMKKLGVKQEDLPATEVIIKFEDRQIVFKQPEVSVVDMMGQETFQITGKYEEQELDTMPDINEDDIQTIVTQVGCSKEQAKKALFESKGDIAEAILNLQK